MKLPETRKERIQIFILIGLGAVFVIAGFVVGVVNPLVNKRKERHANIQRLQEELNSAQAHIDQMIKDRVVNSNVVQEITSANRHILHSRLGNFLLEASETVDEAARRVGVGVDSVTEAGISSVPVAKGKKDDRALRIYTARVKLSAGVHELVRLIRRLEADNPFLTITIMDITSQPKSPATHDITFDVQWPIWDTSDDAPPLAERLRESEEELAKQVIPPYDSTKGLRALTGAEAGEPEDENIQSDAPQQIEYPGDVQPPALPGGLPPLPGQ